MTFKTAHKLAFGLLMLVTGAVASAGPNPNGGQQSGPATPQALAVTSAWQAFNWSGTTLPVVVTENPFTFTCGASGCTVKITDAFICGDYFSVTDGVQPVGQTSIPACTGASSVSDPDLAYADAHFSHGAFFMGPGSHALNLSLVAGFYNAPNYSGSAYIKVVDNPNIPTLSEWGMIILSGLLALATFVALRSKRM